MLKDMWKSANQAYLTPAHSKRLHKLQNLGCGTLCAKAAIVLMGLLAAADLCDSSPGQQLGRLLRMHFSSPILF